MIQHWNDRFCSSFRNRWLAHWAAARPDYRTITNISISVTAKQHRRFLDSLCVRCTQNVFDGQPAEMNRYRVQPANEQLLQEWYRMVLSLWDALELSFKVGGESDVLAGSTFTTSPNPRNIFYCLQKTVKMQRQLNQSDKNGHNEPSIVWLSDQRSQLCV